MKSKGIVLHLVQFCGCVPWHAEQMKHKSFKISIVFSFGLILFIQGTVVSKMVGHNIKNAFGGVFEHLIEQDFAQFPKLMIELFLQISLLPQIITALSKFYSSWDQQHLFYKKSFKVIRAEVTDLPYECEK